MNEQKPKTINGTVVLPVVRDFDWSSPLLLQVLLSERQKEVIESFHEQGIQLVLSPAYTDGKLVGFGMIPAERASQ